MTDISARAYACLLAAVVTTAAGCTGKARHADADAAPVVRVGTFDERGVPFLALLLSGEPLVSVDWNGRAVYRLAEAASVSDDGAVVKFSLRPRVTFHSGDLVTASRVRHLLMQSATLRAQVAGIDVPDDRTLLVRPKRAGFLSVVDFGDYLIEDSQDHRMRTGPFRLVSLGDTAVLERFREYHQGAPAVDRVEIRRYPTHRAAWTAMLRGEVNFLHEVNRDAIDFLEAGGSVKVYPALRPYVVSLVFNLKHPVLQRQDVRVALGEAIDREEVVLNGMRGHGQAAEGPFWPHYWAYSIDRQPSRPNPEAATLRLEAASLSMRRGHSGEMPSRFRFVCLICEDDPRFERMALVVQRQLYAVGVDMQLQSVPLRDLESRLKNGEYDAFLIEMVSGRALTYPYRWWRSPNPTGYRAADGALDRMKLARTDDEVRSAVADVMRVLRADPPAVFLASPREARALDRAFHIPYEQDRDVFGTLWQIEPAVSADRRP